MSKPKKEKIDYAAMRLEARKISRGEERPGAMTWLKDLGGNKLLRIRWQDGVVKEQECKRGDFRNMKLIREYECGIHYDKRTRTWELDVK